MYEKLLEHWLTEVNELGYQLPFCEVLLFEGYTILHVSTHGRGEHGKDIVARRKDGVLCTFQLKGGDINLPAWRLIRGEVEELVQLEPRTPGVATGEKYIPYLVTNGELAGDAPESITQYTDAWVAKGYPRLEVWSRRIVLQKFIDAREHFLPTSLADFRQFVELFTGNFEDRLPREQFALFLERFVDHMTGLKPLNAKRALAAMSIVSGYITEGYERVGNHLSAAESYSMTACATLGAVERFDLAQATYAPVLELLRLGFDRAMEGLTEEVLSSADLVVQRASVVDGPLYGSRALLAFGWIGAWLLRSPGPDRASSRFLVVLRREVRAIRCWTEADWPLMHSLALYLERVTTASEGEGVLSAWLRAVLSLSPRGDGVGLPNPYWSTEKALQLRHGMLPPHEMEPFRGRSFTLAQCLDCLVRRLRRQLIAHTWATASHIEWAEFVPANIADYFRWRAAEGELRITIPPLTAKWGEWRERTARVSTSNLPKVFLRHPEWLLPFLLCYPHRANAAMTALVEGLIARRCEVVK